MAFLKWSTLMVPVSQHMTAVVADILVSSVLSSIPLSMSIRLSDLKSSLHLWQSSAEIRTEVLSPLWKGSICIRWVEFDP